MSRIEFNVVALGDFSSVNAQLASLRKNVAGLNAQLVGLGVSSDVASSMAAMNSQFKASLLSSGAFTAKTVQLTAETEKFGQALTSGKLKLSQYFQIIKAGAAQSTAEMRALAMEQAKLASSMVVADPLKRGVFSVLTPTHINAVTNATKIATIQQNLYNIAVQKGSLALINWGKNTQWAGRQMTVGLSMPIIMFGAVASKAFADVTQEIVRMQKVYGEGVTAPTQQELDKITGQVKMLTRELAAGWGVAAKDTAKMAADLAATGLTGGNLVGATKEGMRLSKLGELEQESAMTAVIALQNVYKLSTNELTKSIDFLNAVENQTSTSLQDLADSIPKVGPIVKQLGGDFKDTAAMIVSLKEAGVPAGQAANAIKSALASILNPTKAAREAFSGFGIDVAGISKVTGGKPVEMLQLLNRELSKLEPLSRAQLIEKMFGKYQFARVSALLDNMNRLGTQTQTVFKLMGATDSELAKMADRELKLQTQSATGKFKIAVETIKADLVPIGEKFIKIFTILLQGIDKFIHAFDKLGPFKNFLGLVLGIALVVGPIVMLTGVMANFVGYVAKGILGLTNFAKGGTHVKELLTAQSVAAAQASDIMTKSTMKEAEVMQLVTKAVTQLNMQMEKLIGLKATASTSSMIATGFTPNGVPIAAPVKPNGDLVKMQMAHMVNPLATFSLAQATAAADKGFIKVNGEVIKLSDTMVRDIRKIQSAVSAGLLTAEEAARIRFSALSNSVVYGQGSVNRAMMGNRQGVSGQTFIQKEIFAGNLAPQMALANARGANIGAAAAAALEVRFNNITKTLVETDASYKMINNKNREVLTRDVLGRLEKELMALNATTNPLKQEMIRYLQQIKFSGSEVSKLGVNVGSAAAAMKLLEQKGMTAFAGGSGRSDYRLGFAGVPQYSASKIKVEAAQYANFIRQEYMKLDQIMAEGDAKMQGRLAKSKITMSMAYKEGLQKAIVEAQALIKQGVDVDVAALEAQVKKNVPKAKLAGMTLAQAFNAGYKEAGLPTPNAPVPVAGAKTPGMGVGMGASMAMMGGSMALSSSGAKGAGAEIAQGALSMGSMGAMAGMMIAGGAYLLPILAAAVAIGGLIAAMKHLSDEHKKHEIMVVNSMKASTTAFDIFGGKIDETTSHIFTFAHGTERAVDAVSELEKNIDAIRALKDDDPFKQMAESLKNLDGTALIGTVRQFAAAQVAKGMDPEKVDAMVAALLTYAGKSQYVSAAQKTISASTKDVQTATETWLNKLHEASGSISIFSEDFDKLSKKQQAYANGLLDVSLSIIDITTPVDKVVSQMKALDAATINSAEAFKALILAAEAAGQMDFANVITQMQNLGVGFTTSILAAKLNLSVPMPQDTKDKKVTAEDLNAWLSSEENWTDALTKAQGVASTTYYQKKQQASIQDQISALEKQKKAIDDQISAQKENTAELKRQNDFKLKESDLKNQIKIAEASGDYLKANLLRQDIISTKFDFQSGNKTPLELQSEALGKKIEALQDSSEKVSKAMAAAALKLTAPKDAKQIAAEAKIYSEMFKNAPLFAKGTPQNPIYVKTGGDIESEFADPKKTNIDKLVVPQGVAHSNKGQVVFSSYFDEDNFLTEPGRDWVTDNAKGLEKNKIYDIGGHQYRYDGKNLITQGLEQEKKNRRLGITGTTIKVANNAQTGRVEAGMPTWVGEVRPEIFIPDSSGYMINPSDLQSRFSRSSYDVPGMSNFSASGLAGAATNNSNSTIINNFEICHPDGNVIVDDIMTKINLQAQKSGTITKIGYGA